MSVTSKGKHQPQLCPVQEDPGLEECMDCNPTLKMVLLPTIALLQAGRQVGRKQAIKEASGRASEHDGRCASQRVEGQASKQNGQECQGSQ